MNDISGYFDWAATAPVDEDIIREATELSINCFGNPSSVHKLGTIAKNELTQIRKIASKTLCVKEENLFFTSGGTEADHIPLLSLLQRPSTARILVSEIEHPAIKEQAEMLKHYGWKIDYVKPNPQGIITAKSVEDALKPDTVLLCVMAVNNETGAIQPINEIADTLYRIAKETGKRRTKFHVDCVQAAGKIPLNIGYRGIDSASFSGHKIGGPRGSGLLYLAQRIEPFVKGGGQEQGIRSGTENLAANYAFVKCLQRYYISADSQGKILQPDSPQAKRYFEQQILTNEFIQKLTSIKGCKIIPECRSTLSPETQQYSPWIIQATFPKIPGKAMVRALSEKGFYISTGSACSARKLNRPVLEAMGISREDSTNAVRFSFGPKTKSNDMENLFQTVNEVCKTLNY
ncbi:MAG: cysteine desulfurase [Spirochaetaceae bacterium]|nr:cysteine desulfurase [Spirochaetaceae bacterium]